MIRIRLLVVGSVAQVVVESSFAQVGVAGSVVELGTLNIHRFDQPAVRILSEQLEYQLSRESRS